MPNIEVIIIEDKNLEGTAFGSYETCKDVYKTILSKYPNAKMTICKNEDDLQGIIYRKPDLVVLTNKIIMAKNGKEMWLSEYFEHRNINYTGSGKDALKYDINKISSKLKVFSHGIRTARFFITTLGEYKSLDDIPIPFPLFIKPAHSANSNGIDQNSFAINFEDFQSKVKELYDKYKQPILVEEYLSGREFTVAIIQADTLLVVPIEIVPPLENDIRILSSKIKTDDSEILKVITDINLHKKISKVAIRAFRALGARDFGRIDIRMDANGKCYFIEANLTPGMKRGRSYFPLSYELSASLTYDEVLNFMIESALKRNDLGRL